jgi:hypothetical protein
VPKPGRRIRPSWAGSATASVHPAAIAFS